MSSNIPTTLQGSQSPNTFEFYWDKHRRKVVAVFWLLAAAMGVYYGVRYYNQSLVNQEWSGFAANTLLESGYSPESDDPQSAGSLDTALIDQLKEADAAELEKGLASASSSQRPYFLWLMANKAVLEKDWAKAESILDQLLRDHKSHLLCTETAYPEQVRRAEKEETKPDVTSPPKEPKLKPALAGSMVSRLKEQIAAAKGFEEPATFRKPEIPADAPRYKISLSGGYGEFVIALMTSQAPKHCEEFAKLVEQKFWDEVKVDEINRPVKANPRWFKFMQFHFGYAITKTETDRSKWDTTKPSEHLIEESTRLSHFEGAVCARTDSDGKSAIDRIWICGTDLAPLDGTRQVFGFVVEGLDVVKRVCEADLSNSNEEQMGRGKPAENISITSVTRL